jgi:hypothetical protein
MDVVREVTELIKAKEKALQKGREGEREERREGDLFQGP